MENTMTTNAAIDKEEQIADTALSEAAQNSVDTPETSGSAERENKKTFSQEELNRIIGERLSKGRSQRETELSEREQELEQKELIFAAKEELSAEGLPIELLEALNISSKKAFTKSFSILREYLDRKVPAVTPGFKIGISYDDNAETQGFGNSIFEAMGIHKTERK